MAARKTATAKAETVEAVSVETVKEEVQAEAPKAAKKTTAKKTTVKKAVEKEEKEPAEKKTTAKKTTTRKTTTKKTAVSTVISVQFGGKSYSQEELLKIAKDVWQYDLHKEEKDLVNVELYVKPEESMVYYVFNGTETGSFAI